MFKSKVVFVLGAGASAEVNMPVGRKLADTICNKMAVEQDEFGEITSSGDSKLFGEISSAIGKMEALRTASRLRSGLPLVKSIDEFLDFNSDDEHLAFTGKTAIIKAILEAEHASSLAATKPHAPPSLNVAGASNSWMIRLMRMLGQSDPAQVLGNVTFITFNYDRSLEFFLFHSIRALYALPEATVWDLVKSADIFHPYGTAGKLNVIHEPNGVPFGRSIGPLRGLAGGIRTFTEEVKEAARLKQVYDSLHAASAIIFLGFAFHQQNMNLLCPPGGLGLKKVFATTAGISAPDTAIILGRLKEWFQISEWIKMNNGNQLHFHSMPCAELLDHYQLTLPNI